MQPMGRGICLKAPRLLKRNGIGETVLFCALLQPFTNT